MQGAREAMPPNEKPDKLLAARTIDRLGTCFLNTEYLPPQGESRAGVLKLWPVNPSIIGLEGEFPSIK